MRSKFEAQEVLDAQRSEKQEGSSVGRVASDYVGRPTSSREPATIRLDEIDARVASLERAIEQTRTETAQALRRAKRDLDQTANYAIADFAAALLPFKDSLDAALRTETSDLDAFKRGIELALRQLTVAFEKHGLVEIRPFPGDPFDPVTHRASTEAGTGGAGLVVKDIDQNGYLMGDRLIRPAAVTLMARE